MIFPVHFLTGEEINSKKSKQKFSYLWKWWMLAATGPKKKKVLIAISWCFHTTAAERTVMLEVIKSISPRGFCFLFFCCCCWKKWPPVNGPEYLLCNLQSPHIFNEDNFHVSLLIRKIILTSWRTKSCCCITFKSKRESKSSLICENRR